MHPISAQILLWATSLSAPDLALAHRPRFRHATRLPAASWLPPRVPLPRMDVSVT